MSIGPEITVPDFTEAVVGYRRFRLASRSQHNFGLYSPHTSHRWDKPEATAKCEVEPKVPEGLVLAAPPKPHSAPAKDCGCGIYAYFKPCPVPKHDMFHHGMDPWGRTGETVTALMTLSGRIEVHSQGMRAQKAKIEALGMNENLSVYERTALRGIGEAWGIPVVPQSQLPKLAAEFGAPLPEDAKPSTEEATDFHAVAARLEQEFTAGPRRYVPWVGTVWINGVVAVGQCALWAVWHKPASLFAMAVSTGFAAWWAGRRREAKAA